MISKVGMAITTGMLIATTTQAALDLGYLNTQTVRAGQPWSSIETKINSVNVNMEIDHGVVTTVATIEYTPGKGIPQYWNGTAGQALSLDSLETTANFQSDVNTAITDMYLWVGQIKVKAELQGRTQASAQYENIVKRRRDPALIESWGNGSYNLRIFPNKSGFTRKIEITFVQGMENNGALFSTTLPLISTLASTYSPFIADYAAWPKRTLGSFNLNAVSKDGKAYSLKWEGLGSGMVGSIPLNLHATNLLELKEGVVSTPASACLSCLDPWVAEKNGTAYFGIKGRLDSKSLNLEAEPLERDILIDVAGADSMSAGRARKYALLALKAYVQTPYFGNLGFSDGRGNISYVFVKPVTMNAANLKMAYLALKSWKPNGLSDTKAALTSFANSRSKTAAPCVALLINDETTPYFTPTPMVAPVGSTDYSLEINAFEAAQQKLADELSTTLNSAKVLLFGFWNNYRITQIAQTTGGYQLGGLFGWIYSPYGGCMNCETIQGIGAMPVDPMIPPVQQEWYMPPLFGSHRTDGGQITNLSVKTSGVSIDSLTILQDMGYFEMYGGPMVMMKSTSASAKTNTALPYYWQSPESSAVRMAGQFHSSGPLTLTLTGTWGGLKFTKVFTTTLTTRSGAGSSGASIWANQQTEAWANVTLNDDLIAIQNLGRDYHFVNSQISLLALEPGMALWTDMPGKPGQTANSGTAGISAPQNDKAIMVKLGSSLDSTSLEEILSGVVSGIVSTPKLTLGNGEITVHQANGHLHFSWSIPESALRGSGLQGSGQLGNLNSAHFQILDLSGRQVADLSASSTGNLFHADWNAPVRSGTYILRAKSGTMIQTSKLELR